MQFKVNIINRIRACACLYTFKHANIQIWRQFDANKNKNKKTIANTIVYHFTVIVAWPQTITQSSPIDWMQQAAAHTHTHTTLPHSNFMFLVPIDVCSIGLQALTQKLANTFNSFSTLKQYCCSFVFGTLHRTKCNAASAGNLAHNF